VDLPKQTFFQVCKLQQLYFIKLSSKLKSVQPATIVTSLEILQVSLLHSVIFRTSLDAANLAIFAKIS